MVRKAFPRPWVIGMTVLLAGLGALQIGCETTITEVETVVVTDTVAVVMLVHDTTFVEITDTVVVIRVDTVSINDTTFVDREVIRYKVINTMLEGTMRDVYDWYCEENQGVLKRSLAAHWDLTTNLMLSRLGQGPDPLSCRT
jgi:hypothetical protein